MKINSTSTEANSRSQVQINKPATTSKPSTAENKAQSKFSLDALKGKQITSDLKEILQAGEKGEVHEEQLQFGIVASILKYGEKDLSSDFIKAFSGFTAKGDSTEDSVKNALKSLVTKGSLSESDASSINGISFRAAQLDTNMDALFDGKGGKNDPTVAVAAINDAIGKAENAIAGMLSGSIKSDPRALDLPSNSKPNSQSAGVSASGATSATTSIGASSQNLASERNGFLWKPVSESNGKLVVLLPPSLSGKIQSAAIYSSLPPTQENLLESGRFTGNGNGGRDHFRFGKPGGSYPDGAYVVAQLRDGNYTTFQVKETSARSN